MKASCEIIRDLLPLYHDGVCSNDSKAMIDEHLGLCDGCKVELQTMNDMLPINNVALNLKEAEAVEKLSKKWRRGMLKSILKGILITVVVIAAMALILYCFIDIRIVPSI